ncbi:bifunctional alpha,alpha-trehalose-phosphate synthase (UDP-forming)/trehalose-phosphatase [Geochorda subterranea]|uniref:Alpha,alpha-trehalose-phosphate synthase n=1 Tax=Geochorda subterranea TaxID=3109564 RepID=A0ABZ1BLC6_9FIRM|nr:bifunctional alpha,alpha-trehalose-phosphate synthase (UDP-forming)/trehalose-phosphatase [Limnochorda sp. LNt]WRP13616.1 bifunctional alpha,alpha-trehalose-phosphate synthase (UDP-forming)/trehalose-phosphatase [Limnochorda sp. LNt]
MARLVVVANRLPVSVIKRKDGLRVSSSPGGLASGLSACFRPESDRWVGWPGIAAERLSMAERESLEGRLRRRGHCPVFLSQEEVERYYLGFSNRTLWPLAHYFPQYAVYDRSLWEAYRRVNQRFAETVVEVVEPGDTIWVHDYQLMLLPGMLRQRLGTDATIGFFLHIPFPSFEVFRTLPWRREMVEGLMGADLVGFHTYDDALHFLESVRRLTGASDNVGRITWEGRVVTVDAFPMGIDVDRYAGASQLPEVEEQLRRVRQQLGATRVVLSVDRLDYSKGIPQRLEAFELFLERHPQYRERVTMVMVAVPSRTEVPAYQALKREVDERISRINGRYGTLGWMPIRYLYRSLPFAALAALYHVADVALVTPLRDGMNLVCKEFVASKRDGRGVLILSEMAGAAKQLPEALLVNPHNVEQMAAALDEALSMSEDDQRARNRLMQQRLRQYDVDWWATTFLRRLEEARGVQRALAQKRLTEADRRAMVQAYRAAQCRLILLDYDGTLVPFAGRPDYAWPDPELLELLQALCDQPRNRVAFVSGRDRHTLTRWLGHLGAAMAAEHGVWLRSPGGEWELVEELADPQWKRVIRPVLEQFAAQTPGAFVEEKDFSLVWHYRQVDPALASVRLGELKSALMQLTARLDVGVLDGDRAVEVKDAAINKGRVTSRWLEGGRYDFILAAGDDTTDEDMFAALPAEAYTIKVRFGPTRARYYVDDSRALRDLLAEMARPG